MVLLLDPVPTFAQSFAKSFGGGLGQGFNEGVTGKLNARSDQIKNRSAQRDVILKRGKKYFDDLGLEYTPETEKALYELIDSGQARDAGDALNLMATQLLGGAPEQQIKGLSTQEPSQMLAGPQKGGLREGIQQYKELLRQAEEGKEKPSLADIGKRLPQELAQALLGSTAGTQGFSEATGLKEGQAPFGKEGKLPFGLDRGSIYRDFIAFTLGGIPGFVLKEMGEKAVEEFPNLYKGETTSKEASKEIAKAGMFASLFGAGGELVGSALAKLPGLAKHFSRLFNNGATKEELQEVAANIGRRAEEAGISIDGLNKGVKADVNAMKSIAEEEVASLKGRVSKGGQELGLEAQVAHPEEAIAHRERTSQMLAKEPEVLERALEPKPEGPGLGAKPETIEKRLAIRNAAKQEEMQAHRSMAKAREDLVEAKRDLIKATKQKAPPEHIEALQETVKSLEKSTQSLQERILDAKHRQKYFEPRKSMEDLVKQAEEASTRIRNEAFSQDTKFFEQAAKDLKNDQKYLVDEMKLLERGEVPGHITPDTYLRVQEAYAKSYGEMLNKLKAYKNTLRQQASHLDAETVKRVDDTIHILEQKLKSLNAKTALQRDAILSKKAVKGPQGAFTRHEIRRALGDTIKENSNLQKAMFKVEKAAPSAESMGKYIEAKFHKEGMPKTPEKAQKMLEDAGVPKEEINEFKKRLNERIHQGIEKEKSFSQVAKEVEKETNALPWLKNQWIKRAAYAVLTGGTGFTLASVWSKAKREYYTAQLEKAIDLRKKDVRAGSKKILEIREKMKNAHISKHDRERAEKEAHQYSNAS